MNPASNVMMNTTPQTKARQSLMNTRTSAATLFDKHGSAVSPEG
jgi:hypothetical protein